MPRLTFLATMFTFYFIESLLLPFLYLPNFHSSFFPFSAVLLSPASAVSQPSPRRGTTAAPRHSGQDRAPCSGPGESGDLTDRAKAISSVTIPGDSTILVKISFHFQLLKQT